MVHNYLHPLIQYLHAHPHLGWAFTYAIALLESLAVIGTIIPGSVTMTAIGALIGSGVLPGLPTLFWATLGAYTGDCISYWAGIYYKDGIRRIWPFSKHTQLLTKGEQFFNRHGGKSVVIGRFSGPARSLVPMIAGILLMRPARFLPIAFISAILWAIAYMLPGILLGALSLELPPALATKFILLCLGIIAVLWLLTWLVKYFFNQTWNQIDRALIKLWNYLNVHKNSHWITQLLRNPAHEEDHQQLVRAVFAVLFTLLFVVLTLAVMTKAGFIAHLNLPFYNLLQSLHAHSITNLMIGVTMLGNKWVLLLVAGLVLAWLIWKRRGWAALHWFAAIFLTAATMLVFKIFVYSPRPPIVLMSDSSSSYPSAYVALSVAVFGFLAILIADHLPPNRRSPCYITAITLTLLIGFSRLYLGAHWLSDVAASIFLGMMWLLLAALSYRRRSLEPLSIQSFLPFVLIAVLIVWPVYGYLNFQKATNEYSPPWPIEIVSLQDWWQNPNKILPLYRTSRLGHPSQPLNVQWLGYLVDIEQTLQQQGWESHAANFNLNDTVSRFVPNNNHGPLPLMPILYHNRSPVLFFTKSLGADQRMVTLRLWQPDIMINDGEIPLWLGTVDYYKPSHKLINLNPRGSEIPFPGAVEELTQLLDGSATFVYRLIQISPLQQPREMSHIGWDGKLLLVREKLGTNP